MTITARKPALNLRAELTQSKAPTHYRSEDFYFTGTGADTDFWLPHGWVPKRVYLDEAKKRKGHQEAWTAINDGFRHGVRFAVMPGSGAKVDVEAELK